MAHFKHILALIFIWLSVLSNNCIECMKFAEADGRTEAKEGRSVEDHHTRIISKLFSNLTNDQASGSYAHHAGWLTPSYMSQGTRARISAWGIPNVNYNSLSAVYIAVLNDNGTSKYMVAGFYVNPNLYSGSTDLKLFTAWIGENNGCLNTNCQGFVVSNITGAPVPGGGLAPLSTFNGKDYFLTLSIKKDQKTQDWSLYRDDNDDPILMGWWPKTLFNNTFDYATKIVWAGAVQYPKTETSPPMGSGHAACEGANKAAYISNIKIVDQFGQTTDPDESNVKEITDRTDCFTTTGFEYNNGKGYNFFYGGPAGCSN